MYEARLNEYAAKVMNLKGYLASPEGKKLTRKEREKMIAEENLRPDMRIPGVRNIEAELVEPGIEQLERLTESGEWHMTIVDVKMTSTQTPQGKKGRYSAMVMVGNLKVCARAQLSSS
jgi:hypothetical protein